MGHGREGPRGLLQTPSLLSSTEGRLCEHHVWSVLGYIPGVGKVAMVPALGSDSSHLTGIFNRHL